MTWHVSPHELGRHRLAAERVGPDARQHAPVLPRKAAQGQQRPAQARDRRPFVARLLLERRVHPLVQLLQQRAQEVVLGLEVVVKHAEIRAGVFGQARATTARCCRVAGRARGRLPAARRRCVARDVARRISSRLTSFAQVASLQCRPAPICSACGRSRNAAKEDPDEPGVALAAPGFCLSGSWLRSITSRHSRCISPGRCHLPAARSSPTTRWSTKPTARSTRGATTRCWCAMRSTPRTTWPAATPGRTTASAGGTTWWAPASRSIPTASSSSASTTPARASARPGRCT